MLTQLLHVVAPVFAVAALGWLFARSRDVHLASLTDVVLMLAAPALVFHSLASRSLEAGSLLAVAGGAVAQSLVCGLVAWLVLRHLPCTRRLAGSDCRGLYLAAMFPNTGNLGLPLALLAFGPEGLAAAVLVFSAITLVHYSLGVIIISGRANPTHILRQPLVLAALLGAAAGLSRLQLPAPLMASVELLGQAAVPLMLLSLGIRMRTVRLSRLGPAVLAVALRFIPGLATAWLWVSLLGMTGPARGVVLVTGVLPSAVMNFVLAEAYQRRSEDVASAILLGTLASLVAIPIVLATMV